MPRNLPAMPGTPAVDALVRTEGQPSLVLRLPALPDGTGVNELDDALHHLAFLQGVAATAKVTADNAQDEARDARNAVASSVSTELGDAYTDEAAEAALAKASAVRLAKDRATDTRAAAVAAHQAYARAMRRVLALLDEHEDDLARILWERTEQAAAKFHAARASLVAAQLQLDKSAGLLAGLRGYNTGATAKRHGVFTGRTSTNGAQVGWQPRAYASPAFATAVEPLNATAKSLADMVEACYPGKPEPIEADDDFDQALDDDTAVV